MSAYAPVDLSSLLPPLYARWMKELLQGPVFGETEASCSACAMVSKPGGSFDGREIAFRREVKCCTFQPELPNFLVGHLLADSSPELAKGRAVLESKIAAGVAVTPVGVGVTAQVAEEHQRRKLEGFGRDEALLCPYYDASAGGLCSIWKYRNAICSTYFCKYVRGEVGRAFWRDSVRPLLVTIEKELSRWVLLELGLDEDAFAALFPTGHDVLKPTDLCDPRGVPEAQARRRVWGEWYGREADFYRACAEKVASLGWRDVLRIGGAELRLLAHMTRLAYARLMDTELPETLTVGNYWVVRRGPQTCLVYGYSPMDLVEVPTKLIAILGQLNGRRTAEVPEWLAHEKGLQVEPALLRKMIDFGVLRAGASQKRATPSVPALPQAA